jgi:hypothetical protein
MAGKRALSVDDESRKKPKLKVAEFELPSSSQGDMFEKNMELSPPKSAHSSPSAQLPQKERPIKTPRRQVHPPSPPATASSPDSFATTGSIITPVSAPTSIATSPHADSPLAQAKPQMSKRKASTGDELQQKRAKTNASSKESTRETKSAASDQQAPSQRTTKNGKPKKAPKKSLKGAPAITDLFTPFKEGQPGVVKPKVAHDSWGTKPMAGDGGPKPRPDLPSARSSNAATIPPLWEDRGFRFRKGQFQTRVGRLADESDGEDEDDEGLPLIDQSKHLVIKVMDMRPLTLKRTEPRRVPEIYFYENGTPKDWNNHQALKALNDRRRDAISRLTCDTPWTELEREYLTQLCIDYPDASILEYAERFNYRFKNDYKEKTAFLRFHKIQDGPQDGRTLESVRYEYLSFKKLYDQGVVPQPTREETEKINGKTEGQWLEEHGFGPKDGTKNDKGDASKGTATKKAKASTKQAKSDDTMTDPFEGIEGVSADIKMSPEFYEKLYELAGGYHPEEVRHSMPAILASTDQTFQIRKDAYTASILDSDFDSSSDLSGT